jgi:hypothetical protein
MVKSWSLPIAGTFYAEASVPRTDWDPLNLTSLITYSLFMNLNRIHVTFKVD